LVSANWAGVTREAQPGNPAPRLFRAIKDEAIVNAMGFNNPGAARHGRCPGRMERRGLWPRHPVGVNLGKIQSYAAGKKQPKITAESFRVCVRMPIFLLVNVSSPQHAPICASFRTSRLGRNPRRASTNNTGPSPAPILVKVAPDLSFEALDEILELAVPRRLAGIVATNTTSPPVHDRCPRCNESMRSPAVERGARCASAARR